MLCLVRPDAIMRTGVIQPVGTNQWRPGEAVMAVADRFIAVGQFAFEPDPEVLARQAQAMAADMRRGTRFGPQHGPALVEAARMLARGERVRITSQGRSVDVSPPGG